MSISEYEEMSKRHSGDPLAAALLHTDTEYHRVWLSSSEGMVRAFYNDHATSPTDLIVRFSLDEPVIHQRECMAHQEPGVQHNKNAIAIHRETLAHLGNLKSSELHNLVAGGHDHNIGFTKATMDAFHDAFKRFAIVGSQRGDT